METIWLLARLVLAAVFAVASVGKALDPEGSVKATRGFGVPERFARPIGLALPAMEMLAAVLLLPVSTAFAGAILSLALLTAFLAGMLNSLRKGEAPDCHCFGQFHSEPVGTRSIVRNVVLGAVAILIMTGGSTPGRSLLGWLDGESSAVKVLTAILALVVIAVAAQTWLIVHLLGQNGRMLIRMDELAAQPVAVPSASGQVAVQPVAKKRAPAFSGTGLIGERVTLDGLRESGKPLLVVFSDPGCGPCQALLPEIAAWQKDHVERLTVALVTRGSIDEAREKAKPQGIKNVIIEKDRSISQAYDVPGTPSAVLIDGDGNLASDVAGGAEAIRKIVETAIKPVPTNGAASARAQRPRPVGPDIGSDAPAFTLPDASGADVSLADFSGKETVLLFWNPGCGFCKRLQPDLVEWMGQEGRDLVSIVTITSGTPEAARDMTFSDHVLLDQGFATGRLFGASGTPSAIRVGTDGKIASRLSVGGPAIMTLLKEPASV